LYGGEVNSEVNPETEINKAFGSAAGTDLKAQQLRDSFGQSLDNARIAYDIGVYEIIRDRAKLYYLSALTDAAKYNFDAVLQKAITDNLAPISEDMKRSFIKQLMPTKFDLCAMNEIVEWPSNTVCPAADSWNTCPVWCTVLKTIDDGNFGKGQPELKSKYAFFT
jgi:hypothetical protein